MDVIPAEQLVGMPLHAITEVLGEDGLRDRFSLEIGRFDPAERLRLSSALGLATDLHRDDRRIREPYVNHLLRVAIRIMCHYEVDDTDVIIAAVLHDAVEDHAPELAADQVPVAPVAHAAPAAHAAPVVRAALEAIAHRYGRRVAELVEAVTNPAYDPARDADLQYREHLAVSLERSPWARVIKVSDFTDNGVGVIHISGPKALRAATKYRPLIPMLRNLVGRTDTPLSRWVKRHIFDQLDLAEERFNDLLIRSDGRQPAAPDGT
jgi:hypothetical protein